jgi:hypothetical protein
MLKYVMGVGINRSKNAGWLVFLNIEKNVTVSRPVILDCLSTYSGFFFNNNFCVQKINFVNMTPHTKTNATKYPVKNRACGAQCPGRVEPSKPQLSKWSARTPTGNAKCMGALPAASHRSTWPPTLRYLL